MTSGLTELASFSAGVRSRTCRNTILPVFLVILAARVRNQNGRGCTVMPRFHEQSFAADSDRFTRRRSLRGRAGDSALTLGEVLRAGRNHPRGPARGRSP